MVTGSYAHSQHEGKWLSHQLEMQDAVQGKEGRRGISYEEERERRIECEGEGKREWKGGTTSSYKGLRSPT